jgi:predicted negative regulator of RcsB-dependent stress response
MIGLKKLILFAVICLVAWGYYQNELRQRPSSAVEKHDLVGKSIQTNQEPTVHAESRFQCDGRQYCSQMTSREEAEFFVRNCPNTKMDGDHDGIPCENDSRF